MVDETKSLFKVDAGEGTFAQRVFVAPSWTAQLGPSRRGWCEKEAWASNCSDGPRDSVA